MNQSVVIDVRSISKKYIIATEYEPDTLQDRIVELAKYPLRAINGRVSKPKTKEYWALKNISFQVKKGEVLGIIGKNGAGKSTLLKILSRTTEPTTGSVTMKGRVASLLEVGTGFNPELTGRENIYLNGAILGMSKKEINSKFSDIVSFAGIGQFLNTPVKRYSSGMYIRLAFSVAAHLDSDILILDEVLAVGDAEFQQKSFKKIVDIVKNGKSVLMVSHNMAIMSKLCDRLVYIDQGCLVDIGSISEVIQKYLSSGKRDVSESRIKVSVKVDPGGWKIGDFAEISIKWPAGKYSVGYECDLVAYTMQREKVFALQSQKFDQNQSNRNNQISFEIKNIGFNADLSFDIGFRKKHGGHYDIVIENALVLHPDISSLPVYNYKDNIVTPEARIRQE